MGLNIAGGRGVACTYKSGTWIATPGQMALGAPTLNELRFTRIHVEAPVTITDMAIDLTTSGAAGAVIKLGIYTDAAGAPNSLIVQAPGVIDATAAAGQKQQSLGTGGAAMTTALSAGVYWLAAVSQGATSTYRLINGVIVEVVGDTLANVMPNNNAGRVQSGVSGSLPATAVPTGTNAFVPKVAVLIG